MRVQKVVIFIMMVGFASTTLLAQSTTPSNELSAIPENERQRFTLTLQTYLDHYRAKDWAKVFDMMPRVHTQHPELTKETYLEGIKKYGKRRVIEFRLESTAPNQSVDGKYEILGCAKVKNGFGTSKWRATIYTSIEAGEWVFSDILYSFALESRDPVSCSSR